MVKVSFPKFLRMKENAANRLQRWWRLFAVLENPTVEKPKRQPRTKVVRRGKQPVCCPLTKLPIPKHRVFYQFNSEAKKRATAAYDLHALVWLVARSPDSEELVCPLTETAFPVKRLQLSLERWHERKTRRAAETLQLFWRKNHTRELLNRVEEEPTLSTAGFLSRGGKLLQCPITLEPIQNRKVFFHRVADKAIAFDAIAVARLISITCNDVCPYTQTKIPRTAIVRLARLLELNGISKTDKLLDFFDNLETHKKEKDLLNSLASGLENMASVEMGKIVDMVCDGSAARQRGRLRTTLCDWQDNILQFHSQFPDKCKAMLQVDADRFTDERLRRYDTDLLFDSVVLPMIYSLIDKFDRRA